MKPPIFKEKTLTKRKNEKRFSELMIDDSNLKSCVKNAKHFEVFVHSNSSLQLSSSVVKIDIRRDYGPSAAADAKELRAGARNSFRATGLLP